MLLSPALLYAGTLSLKDAIAIGLENSFEIKSQKLVQEITEENVTQAESKFDPILSASIDGRLADSPTSYAPYNMDYLRQNTYTGTAKLTKLHKDGFTGEFALKTQRIDSNSPYEELSPAYKTVFMMNLTVPLLKNFGKETNNISLKKSIMVTRQAKFALYSRMIDKTAQIETAYRNLTRTNEVLRLAVMSKELAESLLKSDRIRFKAGIAPITEVQEAEAAVAARDEEVVLAETNVSTALNTLDNLLNMQSDLTDIQTESLSKDWIEADAVSTYTTALKMRPDIAQQRIEIEKHNLTIKYLKNQELPELDIVNTLGVIGISGEEQLNSDFKGNYSESAYDMADTEGYELYLGLNFKYPLGQRNAKSKSAAASAEKRRSVYNLKNIERNIKKEVKDAVIIIANSKKRYEISQTSIRLAEKTLEQEMKKLKEGLSDTFRILKFQNDVVSAKLRSINALYDYNKGLAMLHKADGTNLDRYGFKIGE